MHIENLKDKKVAVWGAGREGLAVLRLLYHRFPDQEFTVLNDKVLPDEAASILSEFPNLRSLTETEALRALPTFDLVVKSPGISLYRPEVIEATKEGVIFTSGSSLWFSEHGEEKIVAVTGTKGKSTTAALTAYLLKRSGLKTVVAGNIGTPLLSTFNYSPLPDVWVLELSSYQIADLEGQPDIAVLVSLFSAHLDWHGSLDKYHHDKLRLFSLLGEEGISILNGADQNLSKLIVDWKNPYYFNEPDAIHVKEDQIYDGNTPLFVADLFPLPGSHNLSNLCASLSVVKALGIPPESCKDYLSDFKGLPHRLEDLGVRNGITFINDSISTIPESALAAVASFSGKPVTLLLGGQEKGLDWDDFSRKLCSLPVHAVITIPDSGARMAASLKDRIDQHPVKTSLQIHESSDLTEAIAIAKRITPSGGIVLLSPACPSYGRFRNFEERGRQFAKEAGF